MALVQTQYFTAGIRYGLKISTIVAKGLKLKRLIPKFVEVIAEKMVGVGFLVRPSWIELIAVPYLKPPK